MELRHTHPALRQVDYTFSATPPLQLGNAELALTSLIDTYSANTSQQPLLPGSSSGRQRSQQVRQFCCGPAATGQHLLGQAEPGA
jgi:hypothetical protein